jgi:hypothetical protein
MSLERSGVLESRGDLLTRQLILRREIFGRGSRSERTEHCRNVDAGSRDARLSESDFRVHRDAGINFHVKSLRDASLPQLARYVVRYREGERMERATGVEPATSSLRSSASASAPARVNKLIGHYFRAFT